jgi:hypothetical protein
MVVLPFRGRKGKPLDVKIYPVGAAPAPVRDVFLSSGWPEMHWSWIVTMEQSVIGSGGELVIAALLDDHGLCLSAIPAIRNKGVLRSATSFYTTQFAPPSLDRDSAFLLGKALARNCRELQFDSVPEKCPSASALVAGLRSAGFAIGTYRHFANWYEEISDFSEYWKNRSGRLKSLIQRKGRRLNSERRLTFERIDLRTNSDYGVSLYEAVYAKSWKEPERHGSFMEILIKNLGAAGLAQLGIARIDSQPAAVQVWLVWPPYATIFKLAHDPVFDQHSPGSLLTHWMIKEIHELGARIFDFGRGNDDYKKLWFKKCRFRYGIVAVDPRSLRGAWRYAAVVLPTRLSGLGLTRKIKRFFEQRSNRENDRT